MFKFQNFKNLILDFYVIIYPSFLNIHLHDKFKYYGLELKTFMDFLEM